MNTAQVIKTDDLNYKNGFVQCTCGWHKILGDGFNGYHIANCPACTPNLETRHQREVTIGQPGNYEIQHGDHVYFVLENGIHIRYKALVTYTEHRQRIPR